MRKQGLRRRVLSFGFTVVTGIILAGAGAGTAAAGSAGDQACGFAMAATSQPDADTNFADDPRLDGSLPEARFDSYGSTCI